MAIRSQPVEVVIKSFSDLSHVFTIKAPEVVGNKDCFHSNGIYGLLLPAVCVGGNLNAQIEFKDALVRDGNQSKPVLRGNSFGKQLDRETSDIKHGIDLSLLQLG